MRIDRFSRTLAALVVTSQALLAVNAFAQGGSRLPTGQNRSVPLTERDTELPANINPFDQNSEWAKERRRLPINLKDFVNQELGRKPDEVLEISEINDALNAFERKNKKLIPDRDVLESSSMTAKQLVEALNQRMFRDPSGVKPTSSVPIESPTTITRSKQLTLANARPFQRQALLNNPNGILRETRQGLTNGAGIYYDSGSARNTHRFIDEHSPLLPSGKDIVARAILDVRPDLADPRLGGPFSKYRLTNTQISDVDYARLTRDFENNKTLTSEEWEALDIAIQRLQLNAISEAYSNGQSTLDNRGNRVYSNGQRMFDNNGRPLYPNGKRKFDDDGNELHSNGQRKYNQNGVKLYANGRPKTNRSGIDLFPDANKTRNSRGITLYDNGRARINAERSAGSVSNENVYVTPSGEVEASNPNRPDAIPSEGVPLDPRGRSQVRQRDGVVLYDNGRAKVNQRGVDLYRNGQAMESNRGVELYDNGNRVENSRARALSYNSNTIGSREGFQGRPDGIFPIIRIVPARIRKAADNLLQFVADGTGEEESVSTEGAFVGTEGKEVLPADISKIPPNTRGHVVIEQSWRYVDGQSVGASAPPRLLALFVASSHAKRDIANGQEQIFKLVTGRVAQSSQAATSLVLPNTGGKPEEFSFSNTIAQKSVGGKVTPIAPASLTQGKAVTLLVQSTATFEKGKLTSSTPPVVVAAWQDGPRAP